ncbi:hypothetical protein ACFO1B_14835 [Dactylosporangium siamense]|uniref:hypothetical protein n=1 Tax=Dactylosporangium siamense TaxID=685454 RepID=UPI001943040A|nr:hypothetical protein [Dactylosporangium siamense]
METPVGSRFSVLLAGLVWAVASSALFWVYGMPHVRASFGSGPPAGTVVVADCWVGHDYEGNELGRSCDGEYTPTGADRPSGIERFKSSDLHRPGTVREVWSAGGTLTERYPGRMVAGGVLALNGAIVSWSPLVWLLSPYGRRAEAEISELGMFFLLAWVVVGCLTACSSAFV